MGLDISHGTWHGAYSAFSRWRKEIAKAIEMPPLELMEGFYNEDSGNPFGLLELAYPKGDELETAGLRRIKKQLPIKWASLRPSPLHELLYHSDCDGYINWKACKRIADELSKVIPALPDEDFGGHIGNIRVKTQTFVDGLLMAYNAKEKLQFR